MSVQTSISFSERELKAIYGCVTRTKARFENQLEEAVDPSRREVTRREIRQLDDLKRRLADALY